MLLAQMLTNDRQAGILTRASTSSPFARAKRIRVSGGGGGGGGGGGAIELLEGRMMMSVAAPIAQALPDLPSGGPGAINQLTKAVRKDSLQVGNIVNVSIPRLTSIAPVPGTDNIQGTANALLTLADGTTRNIEALVTIDPQQAEDGCPILHLELNEIDLNLLGLRVQTSDICLNIHAEEGPGNLLGNLLCSLTGLLDGPLTGILDRLNQLLPINLGLTLDRLTNNAGEIGGVGTMSLSVAGNQVSQQVDFDNLFQEGEDGVCNILNLSLGPVDLNLLGLVIGLDDCADGPVTVDVTAVPGPGNLLGNLLCGVTHLLDGGAVNVNQVVRGINRLLDRLL